MSEWQPIETAPRNGTPFLCTTGYRHDAWQVVVASFRGRKDFPIMCCSSTTMFNATHWMPLPEPPARPAPKGKAPSVPIGKDKTKEEILEIMEVMTKEVMEENVKEK